MNEFFSKEMLALLVGIAKLIGIFAAVGIGLAVLLHWCGRFTKKNDD